MVHIKWRTYSDKNLFVCFYSNQNFAVVFFCSFILKITFFRNFSLLIQNGGFLAGLLSIADKKMRNVEFILSILFH